MDGLGSRTCRPINAKVKGSRTRNRFAKVRKISINQGDISSNTRNRPLKGIDKGHIIFRMDGCEQEEHIYCPKANVNCRSV